MQFFVPEKSVSLTPVLSTNVLPEGDIVGHDTQQVDHVHALLDEIPLEGGSHEPHTVLNGEPSDEDRLGDGKVSVLICLVGFRVSHLRR